MEITELQEILQVALETYKEEGIEEITTFERAGLLIMNEGLVIKTWDGSEFQLTIVKSK